MQICNFRSVKALAWAPSAGINCLVGSGDSGKSTILDAIDLCLEGAEQLIFWGCRFS
ncbi:ATP-binding protein [Derxia lacustris]|uniref:ATP-binding protein n=1 Tax=Derxia lacustris TaxID=764842 RepID=UPI002287259B|nr:ATP-binding protein [Derxia lacustris]